MTKDFYILISLVTLKIMCILGVILSGKFPYSFYTNVFIGGVIWLIIVIFIGLIGIVINKLKELINKK